jgi:D-alanyl-D-alanine carboxypeptidase-like protein
MAYLYPSSRGWGPGFPNCSYQAMVPLEVDGIRFGSVRREVHDLAEMLITETIRRGYVYHRSPQQQWGYNCRAVRGSTAPSFHSWGLALDFNSATNWLGRTDGGDIPSWMVSLWHDYGWGWGGNYTGRKDPMHFEYGRTPADAVRDTQRARDNLGGDDVSPEDEETLRRAKAFLDAVTGPLKPGKDAATAAGAGSRVARSTLAVEQEHPDPNGVDH